MKARPTGQRPASPYAPAPSTKVTAKDPRDRPGIVFAPQLWKTLGGGGGPPWILPDRL